MDAYCNASNTPRTVMFWTSWSLQMLFKACELYCYSSVRKWLKAWVAINSAAWSGSRHNYSVQHVIVQRPSWTVVISQSICCKSRNFRLRINPALGSITLSRIIHRKSLDARSLNPRSTVLSGLNQSWFFPYQTCAVLIKHHSGISDDFGLFTIPFVKTLSSLNIKLKH